ncbi:MAG TPA: hypothetical protein VHE81_18500 [Lacipirellulaceae bacterium]|nr:hypothetical protein [Lacipirellulaceae bacterium]
MLLAGCEVVGVVDIEYRSSLLKPYRSELAETTSVLTLVTDDVLGLYAFGSYGPAGGTAANCFETEAVGGALAAPVAALTFVAADLADAGEADVSLSASVSLAE